MLTGNAQISRRNLTTERATRVTSRCPLLLCFPAAACCSQGYVVVIVTRGDLWAAQRWRHVMYQARYEAFQQEYGAKPKIWDLLPFRLGISRQSVVHKSASQPPCLPHYQRDKHCLSAQSPDQVLG